MYAYIQEMRPGPALFLDKEGPAARSVQAAVNIPKHTQPTRSHEDCLFQCKDGT